MSLNIALVYGSYRSGRLGLRAVRFFTKELEKRGHQTQLIDAKALEIPFLAKTYGDMKPEEISRGLQEAARIIAWADAFAFVVGEYNNSLQPGLTNIIDHFYPEWGYKPSVVVSYSYGPFAGVRAMTQIRTLLGEINSVAIGRTLPIPSITKALDKEGEPLNPDMPGFAKPVIDQLEWYTETLKEGRENHPLPE